jgi:hypothetical protein
MAQLQHSTATNAAEALDGAFKQIRILHAVFLASIPLFAYSGEVLASERPPGTCAPRGRTWGNRRVRTS